MVELKERKRKVDVEKLSPEEQERIGELLGKKLNEIVDEAVTKANTMLEIYNCKVIMQLELKPLPKPKE